MATRFGILGAGGISRRFASVLKECGCAELSAVAARDLDRAEAFAREFGANAAYGDYDALPADPAVDAVYVGLTHNLHADLVRRALLAGKAVLCEKPMAVCAADARALADLAREKNLLLREGMWTRCMPAVRRATQWVQKGVSGPVRLLRAAFCFDAPFDPQSRLFNPDLCGGALLDAGVYPIEFAMGVLGEHPVETAGVQLPADDLGALGNQNSLLRLQAVAQLGLRQMGEYRQLRGVQVGDLNDSRHVVSSPPVLKWLCFLIILHFLRPGKCFRHGGNNAAVPLCCGSWADTVKLQECAPVLAAISPG